MRHHAPRTAATLSLSLTSLLVATNIAVGRQSCPPPLPNCEFCPSVAPASFPLQPGMGVVTCFSGIGGQQAPAGFVVGVVDVRDPVANAPAPVNCACPPVGLRGEAWCAPMFHNEFGSQSQPWTSANLGEVFGLTLDDEVPPNIYVTPSTVYGDHGFSTFGPTDGTGTAIYRIDGATGAISVIASLADPTPPIGTPASLGNICFDSATQCFFVSNFDDGLISAVPKAGGVVFTFDHGVAGRAAAGLSTLPDTPSTEFTPLGRRVWGVAVLGDRLYYSVYWEDMGRPDTQHANEIWSVAIAAGPSGTTPFVSGSARLEISIPAINHSPANACNAPAALTYSNPVSSIAFSREGRMLLAERSKIDDYGTPYVGLPCHLSPGFDAHGSRVLEYVQGGIGAWVPSPNQFKVGISSNPGADYNAAGGADYGCELEQDGNPVFPAYERVWASGDLLSQRCQSGPTSLSCQVYGLIGIESTGNGLTGNQDGYFIDLDGIGLDFYNKTQLGDVEIFCPECMLVDTLVLDCAYTDEFPPIPIANTFTWTFTLTNNSGTTASSLNIPFPNVSPNPIVFPGGLAPGASTTVTLTLSNQAGGLSIMMPLILFSTSGQVCCSQEIGLSLPECNCLQALDPALGDSTCTNGLVTFDFLFLLQNLFAPHPIEHVFFIVHPQASNPAVSVSPTYMSAATVPALNPSPVPVYGVAPITLHVNDAVPNSVVEVEVIIHSGNFLWCCSETIEIGVPDCPPATSNCCCENGTPQGSGCETPDCEAAVCAVDPFCCRIQWNEICCEEAHALCGPLCGGVPMGPPSPDLNGDGSVGAADLAILLGNWGSAGVGDLNSDRVVDAVDLSILLGAWTS